MDSLTFYFDRCFGKRLPQALDLTRPPFSVVWQHSGALNLKEEARDDEWLEMCGVRKWIAFSHDRKFHSIEVEAAAIRQHNVACFCLCGANETTFEKLRYFISAYPRIMEIANAETPPYLYRIQKGGSFRRVQLER